jgi:hypothetical protein
VLPFTVGIRDSAVQLVSTLGSVVYRGVGSIGVQWQGLHTSCCLRCRRCVRSLSLATTDSSAEPTPTAILSAVSCATYLWGHVARVRVRVRVRVGCRVLRDVPVGTRSEEGGERR